MNDQAPPKSGTGCFVRGCLVVLVAGIALAVVVGVGSLYLYRKVIDGFTSTQPVDIQVAAPTEGEFQAAQSALDRVRSAIANNREETIAFSAAALNALVTRDREFSGARKRVRFAMADSVMTLDLSAPVESLRWPRLKDRWFNGTARFTLRFEYDQFMIAPLSIQAAGWRVPEWLLTSDVNSSFSRSFTKSFHDAMRRNPQGAAVWNHIKAIRVQDDKLVITTGRF
jgi:uncharacterized MAPEG superfamily protein